MTSSQIVPAVLIPFIAWRIYSRVRLNIGRQLYRPRRLMGASIFFTVILALIALGAARFPTALAGLGGGFVIAVPLGLLALRLTKWENSTAGEFYTPNTTIGLAVTLLFLGRIAYRIFGVFGSAGGDIPPPSMMISPLTLFVFGVTGGFYVTYYLGLYLHGRKELEKAKSNSLV